MTDNVDRPRGTTRSFGFDTQSKGNNLDTLLTGKRLRSRWTVKSMPSGNKNFRALTRREASGNSHTVYLSVSDHAVVI